MYVLCYVCKVCLCGVCCVYVWFMYGVCRVTLCIECVCVYVWGVVGVRVGWNCVRIKGRVDTYKKLHLFLEELVT